MSDIGNYENNPLTSDATHPVSDDVKEHDTNDTNKEVSLHKPWHLPKDEYSLIRKS